MSKPIYIDHQAYSSAMFAVGARLQRYIGGGIPTLDETRAMLDAVLSAADIEVDFGGAEEVDS